MKIFGIVRSAVQLITDRFVADDLRQPNLTLRGNIAVESIIIGPSGSVPVVADIDDSFILPAQTIALGIAENYIYGPDTNTWNRAQSIPDNADGQAAVIRGAQGVIAREQIFNGATFDRVRSVPDDTDTQAPLGAGTAGVVARLQGYSDTSFSFDRIRSDGNNADAKAVKTLGGLETNTYAKLFNGVTWDRERGNTAETVLASAARTVTTASADLTNYNQRGVHVAVDVTVAGTSTLTVTIQGKDPVSGNYYDLLIGTAIAAAGLVILKLYPGIGTLAGGAASDILPRIWRVNCAKGDASAWTYSVGANLVK